MTYDELINTVPVHRCDGHPLYVVFAEIPQPWRDRFQAALGANLSQCPVIEGLARDACAYAWDWRYWVGANVK